MEQTAGFWIAAAAATFFIGMSKGGIPMVAMLGVPILSIFIPPGMAAGLLLPMYILADAYAIWLFRGQYSLRNIRILVPAGAIGVLIAFVLVSRVPVEATKLVVALIGLGYLADALRKRLKRDYRARDADVARGLFWGALSGFTSYISHAGGPPYQAYMLPQKLPKMTFAGTTAIVFACINWMKAPTYVLAGQLTWDSLKQVAVLAPVALLGAWAGFRFTRLLPERLFFTLIYSALGLLCLKLLFEVGAAWL
ncbi:sulfite exporter TauE/SafE family protein [Salipiger sp. 1_MG-2023]|uniref:sulfite exporter TauE/SafE family protein n=1 Tax=Salipiger sp. 1_MG-2023 TaxID=3062665 RepID=UPI0026E3DE2A|nr:sulfite exporter TauE/SafE family protein [Salipiger sp. 1_MG-2023]MDO6585424.1 sulfite exporter TauE/SafE family protein [Salipiger sp. 1_MG-2023]